jgi:2-dehydropantoate 2-reductase
VRALVVGAGAVGQVYARHLQQAGAEIGFLVREKYAAAARAGFDLYPLNRADPRRAPVRLEGFAVLTSPAEAARERWDAVFLCVSSTALRSGPWLEELAGAIGDATLVTLQPGIEDRDYVLARVPADRVVSGLIGMVSYQAPLPGEEVPRPGVAYWLPPLSECPLAGPRERTEALVRVLARGGLRSRVHPNLREALAFGGTVLEMHTAALECAGWSFRGLGRDRELLSLASRAVREGIAISARRLEARPPLLPRLVRPWHMRLVLRLAPCVAPLDLETYFRVHFTKVGDQMDLGLATHLALAARFGLEAPAIRELAGRVERARAPAGAGAGA